MAVADAYQPPAPFAALEKIDLPPALLSTVKKQACWSWYGPFDAITLSKAASVFVASNSDAEEETPASSQAAAAGQQDRDPGHDGDAQGSALQRVFRRFLQVAVDDCVAGAHPAARDGIAEACWLEVRMFKPTTQYATPRWHRDGRMFSCTCTAASTPPQVGDTSPPPRTERHHAKYAITLLGPQTRFLRLPNPVVDQAHTELTAAERRGEIGYAEYTAGMAARLRGQEELAVERGRVVRFSWGQKDSPVHSEPDWSGLERVFVSVLFGTEEELRVMCEWRNCHYGVASASRA